jgi:hypothetical protein
MNGVTALSGVVGAVRCPATVCWQTVRGGRDTGDVLIGGDLGQQFGQHGRVADIAAGDLDRPNLQCFLVDPEMNLAPNPSLGAAMLACVPFTCRATGD